MDLILGLPGDDLKGFLGSVKNIMMIEPNKFQTFPLSILPGSDYDRRRKELGITEQKHNELMKKYAKSPTKKKRQIKKKKETLYLLLY